MNFLRTHTDRRTDTRTTTHPGLAEQPPQSRRPQAAPWPRGGCRAPPRARAQLSRNLAGGGTGCPAARLPGARGSGVRLLQWLQVRGRGDGAREPGASTAKAPRSGDRPTDPGRHIPAAGGGRREGTYGTRRAPSSLCRGRCWRARARAPALPRSLAAPPASCASRLAVLRRLAAEGRLRLFGGFCRGGGLSSDPGARPAPPAAASRPLRPARLQSCGAASGGGVAAPPCRARGAGLCVARRRNARGKKFTPRKGGREGGNGSRGGDTDPALCLRGGGGRERTQGPGGKAGERRMPEERGARRPGDAAAGGAAGQHARPWPPGSGSPRGG